MYTWRTFVNSIKSSQPEYREILTEERSKEYYNFLTEKLIDIKFFNKKLLSKSLPSNIPINTISSYFKSGIIVMETGNNRNPKNTYIYYNFLGKPYWGLQLRIDEYLPGQINKTRFYRLYILNYAGDSVISRPTDKIDLRKILQYMYQSQ